MRARFALFYFFSYSAIGALFPFLPLLLEGRGLRSSEISWVMATNPVLGLLAPPLWGLLADAYRARTQLLALVSFACAGAVLLLLPAATPLAAVLAMAAVGLFRSPITSLVDAAVHSLLGEERQRFALVRVWGSVGYALCAGAVGLLDASRRPLLLFGLVSALFFASGVVAATLPRAPQVVHHAERGTARALLEHLRGSGLWLLLLANAIYYGAHSSFDGFFSLHLRQLGYGDGFVGAAWCFGVFSEVAFMFLVPRLLARMPAPRLVLVSAVVATVRWAIIGGISAPAPLFLTQVLHGFSFGTWYLAMVAHVQAHTPERLRASNQAMILATMAAGTIACYLAGGPYFEARGGAALFYASAVAAAVSTALYTVALRRPARGRASA